MSMFPECYVINPHRHFKRGPIRGRDIYNQACEPSSLPSNRADSSHNNRGKVKQKIKLPIGFLGKLRFPRSDFITPRVSQHIYYTYYTDI